MSRWHESPLLVFFALRPEQITPVRCVLSIPHCCRNVNTLNILQRARARIENALRRVSLLPINRQEDSPRVRKGKRRDTAVSRLDVPARGQEKNERRAILCLKRAPYQVAGARAHAHTRTRANAHAIALQSRHDKAGRGLRSLCMQLAISLASHFTHEMNSSTPFPMKSRACNTTALKVVPILVNRRNVPATRCACERTLRGLKKRAGRCSAHLANCHTKSPHASTFHRVGGY